MMTDAHVPIATEGDAGGLLPRTPDATQILQQVQPPRLHAAATVRVPGREGTSAQELPPGRSAVARCTAVVSRHRDEQNAGSQHAVPRLSRVEPWPTPAQAPGPAHAVVRDLQTARIDPRDRLQPLRHAPPQQAL